MLKKVFLVISIIGISSILGCAMTPDQEKALARWDKLPMATQDALMANELVGEKVFSKHASLFLSKLLEAGATRVDQQEEATLIIVEEEGTFGTANVLQNMYGTEVCAKGTGVYRCIDQIGLQRNVKILNPCK
ncbi:MAG: hypothetical protein Q8P11_00645 [bacterium]|nr:hypothetical protein [bacterium]